MAEKKTQASTSSGPSLSIGAIFVLIIVGVFIVWVLTGGSTSREKSTTKVIEKSSWPNAVPSYGEVQE